MSESDDPIPLDAETRQVIRLLQASAARCKKLMLNPPGGTESGRAFAASRAAQQLAGINRELDAVKGKLASVAAKKVGAAYRQGVSEADQMAREAGVKDDQSPLAGSFNLVDRRRAQVLAQQTVGDLSKAVDSIKQTTGKVVKQCQAEGLDNKKVNLLLAGGTIDGVPRQTLDALKKMVREAAVDGRIVTVNRTTGEEMHFKPDSYAELVYQTKLAETTNVATLQRLQAKKMFYVKIIGSHSANFCTAFVDRVFYTGPGKDPGGNYPNVRELPRGGPPFHPRCTKRYTAFVPALASPEAIAKAKLTPNEQKLLNKSPIQASKIYGKEPTDPDPAPSSGKPMKGAKGTPADVPGTKSASELVSTRTKGPIAAAVEETLGTIDSLHRMPAGSRPIQIGVTARARWQGMFDSRDWRIQVNSAAISPPATIAHELGHYFEHQAAGGIQGAMTHPAFAEWRDAIRESKTFGELMAKAERTRNPYDAYLALPQEVFARSYAQWVAQKSDNPAIKARMKDLRRIQNSQWDDDEFQPIAAAFEKAIKKLGLKS